MSEEKEIKVKSLQKALEILGCFVEKQPLGVTEISEKLGLYKSNVHNILMTFKAMDYLEQDPETGKFRLGTAVFTLSRALRESLTITRVVLPYMHQIAKEAGELVYLAIPHEDEVVYLEGIYPEGQMLPGRSVTGERSKMYCTSVGKVILSHMPDEAVEEILSREKKPSQIIRSRIRRSCGRKSGTHGGTAMQWIIWRTPSASNVWGCLC